MAGMKTRDKHGREILPGDVLKVYHFTGALRRKKHYMYKYVLDYEMLGYERKGSHEDKYLKISHLSRNKLGSDYYHVGAGLGVQKNYEIVQGEGLDDREKVTSND